MAKFGLIGHPVSHSMSKVMHEAAFKKLGLSHTYELVDVAPENLDAYMKSVDFDGLNVTIPHKVDVIRSLDSLSEDAKILGAVNTVEFKDWEKIGHNTDVYGFVTLAKEEGISLDKKNVLVLGTGGAGRAIALKLAMQECKVSIYDLDSSRSQKVKDEIWEKIEVEARVAQDIKQAVSEAEVLVNATPCGMHPNVLATPVDPALLHDGLAVIDIIYNPLETELVKKAKDAGLKATGGAGMLVHQGARALEIWLDIEPPTDVMKKALIENL